MPWVKIYTETLDEVKLVELTDEQKWRFIQLILVAAECDAEGAIVTRDSPMTLAQLSWRLREESQKLQKDIEKLIQVGLIHEEDGALVVSKFAERQGPTQEHKRQIWRDRQKARRISASHKSVTQESSRTHGGVINKEEEEEEEEDSSRQSRRGAVKHPERQELMKYFLVKTGLPSPRDEIKTMQKLWWSPLDEILKFSGCIETAQDVVDRSVTRLRNKELTISDPNSIIKTARAIHAEINKPGAASTFTETY